MGSPSNAMTDLTVLGQDPRYGGGAAALMDAFIEAARTNGCDPALVYVPHPTFDGRKLTLDRIEARRVLRNPPPLAAPLWVIATTAHHGAAAAASGLPYDAWLATSLDDEWRGRVPGLPRSRRAAQALSARSLRRIEQRVLRRARRLFSISPWSRTTLAAAAGIDESEVRVLPLPVDIDAFAPEPDETWLGRLEDPVLAFVGRADDPRKNAQLLLDAAPLLPGVRIRFIGDPPRGALPPGVEATGRVASVADHLRTASLCIVPARQEGFGLVVAEALAAGVPVVATRSGGPEELIERSGGGVLLDGWTPEEVASVSASLLADPNALLERRRSGREYVVREHSPAVLANVLGGILESSR
jgi:glycosyltransferase involved in cell wall biosynthesis